MTAGRRPRARLRLAVKLSAMKPELRKYFDRHLEHVLARLPPQARKLLDDVPLYVEDYPSRETMREMGVRRRDELCGLYSGTPLIDRSIQAEPTPHLSDVVQIYREGILSLAIDENGAVDEAELREQIRVTILHELGHYHGLDEDDLEKLGYD